MLTFLYGLSYDTNVTKHILYLLSDTTKVHQNDTSFCIDPFIVVLEP